MSCVNSTQSSTIPIPQEQGPNEEILLEKCLSGGPNDGLVKIDSQDVLNYLGDKIIGDDSISVQVIGIQAKQIEISVNQEILAKRGADAYVEYTGLNGTVIAVSLSENLLLNKRFIEFTGIPISSPAVVRLPFVSGVDIHLINSLGAGITIDLEYYLQDDVFTFFPFGISVPNGTKLHFLMVENLGGTKKGIAL